MLTNRIEGDTYLLEDGLAADLPLRFVLGCFDEHSRELIERALPQPHSAIELQAPSVQVTPAKLMGTDLLCIVVGDDPEQIEPAQRLLNAAREADVLTLLFAPPRLQAILGQQVDGLGLWPGRPHERDLISERRLRRRASDLIGCLAALHTLLDEQGLVCVDYADIRAILHRGGRMAVATGTGFGAHRIQQALAEVQGQLAAQGFAREQPVRAVLAMTVAEQWYTVADYDAALEAVQQVFAPESMVVAGLRSHGGADGSFRLAIMLTEMTDTEYRLSWAPETVDLDIPKFLARMGIAGG